MKYALEAGAHPFGIWEMREQKVPGVWPHRLVCDFRYTEATREEINLILDTLNEWRTNRVAK